MKKFISLALALMLVMSFSVTAFAAENEGTVTTDGANQTITVKGTYAGGGTSGDTVKVNVSWDAMTFTYSEAGQVWNSTTHKYETNGTSGWSTETATITVKNHSPFAVTATLSFTKDAALSDKTINGTFTEESGTADDNILELESANNSKYQTATEGVYPAPTAAAEFGISGDAISADATLGTITVTIATKKN